MLAAVAEKGICPFPRMQNSAGQVKTKFSSAVIGRPTDGLGILKFRQPPKLLLLAVKQERRQRVPACGVVEETGREDRNQKGDL